MNAYLLSMAMFPEDENIQPFDVFFLLNQGKCNLCLWYLLYLTAIRIFLGRNLRQSGQISLIPTFALKPHSFLPMSLDVYVPLKFSSQQAPPCQALLLFGNMPFTHPLCSPPETLVTSFCPECWSSHLHTTSNLPNCSPSLTFLCGCRPPL